MTAEVAGAGLPAPQELPGCSAPAPAPESPSGALGIDRIVGADVLKSGLQDRQSVLSQLTNMAPLGVVYMGEGWWPQPG